MNKFFSVTLLLGASTAAFAADDVARVISATPVTQQVGVPRQACATYATPGVAPQCSTQTIYEARTVGYNVVYEFKGRQYSVQMPQNPGPTLRLQVAGVEAATPLPAPMPAPASVPAPAAAGAPAMEIVEDPAMTSGAVQPFPAPVQVTYAYPGYVSYYGSPYYTTWGPVLSLGLVGGYYGGYYGRGHYRGHGHRR
jgi:hypothetical protein